MLGNELKKLRENNGLTVRKIANLMGVDYSLINRFEKGSRRPTNLQLEKYKSALKLSPDQYNNLRLLGGYDKESNTQNNDQLLESDPAVKQTVEFPPNVSVLFSDSIFFTVSPYGVVMNFAQKIDLTNKQIVVSRIGINKDHAVVMIEKLKELLSKIETKSY